MRVTFHGNGRFQERSNYEEVKKLTIYKCQIYLDPTVIFHHAKQISPLSLNLTTFETSKRLIKQTDNLVFIIL